MKDRVPKYPNRVKLLPVAGQENTFDLVRADEPTETGTPLNKATFLKDVTAALLGLDPSTATPDDALNSIFEKEQSDIAAILSMPRVKILTGTYTGTGVSATEDAPMVIEVGFRPKLFMNAIKSMSSSEWAYAKNLMIWFGAVKTGDRYVTASDTGVSWYGSYPMNDSGTQYFWIAIGD